MHGETDDGLGAARGISYGTLFGFVLWAAIAAIWWLS